MQANPSLVAQERIKPMPLWAQITGGVGAVLGGAWTAVWLSKPASLSTFTTHHLALPPPSQPRDLTYLNL